VANGECQGFDISENSSLDDTHFHFQIPRERAINYLESLVIISPHQFGMISAETISTSASGLLV
jgi:hypothetical protein